MPAPHKDGTRRPQFGPTTLPIDVYDKWQQLREKGYKANFLVRYVIGVMYEREFGGGTAVVETKETGSDNGKQ